MFGRLYVTLIILRKKERFDYFLDKRSLFWYDTQRIRQERYQRTDLIWDPALDNKTKIRSQTETGEREGQTTVCWTVFPDI